jgi:hypothetical protein
MRGRSSPVPLLFGGRAFAMRGNVVCKLLNTSLYRASSSANAAGTALSACAQGQGGDGGGGSEISLSARSKDFKNFRRLSISGGAQPACVCVFYLHRTSSWVYC